MSVVTLSRTGLAAAFVLIAAAGVSAVSLKRQDRLPGGPPTAPQAIAAHPRLTDRRADRLPVPPGAPSVTVDRASSAGVSALVRVPRPELAQR
jgi:hypothetical protein